MVAERDPAKSRHSLIRSDCRMGEKKKKINNPVVCGCQWELSLQAFKNAERVDFWVTLIAFFCNLMGGHRKYACVLFKRQSTAAYS